MQFDRVGPFQRDFSAAMSLSFGNATVSVVANVTQTRIECNVTEWDHLNETGFGCDVTLFWKCHRFHREDRVQFDRVGPLERDWVWLRCHSLLEMPPFPSLPMRDRCGLSAIRQSGTI